MLKATISMLLVAFAFFVAGYCWHKEKLIESIITILMGSFQAFLTLAISFSAGQQSNETADKKRS